MTAEAPRPTPATVAEARGPGLHFAGVTSTQFCAPRRAFQSAPRAPHFPPSVRNGLEYEFLSACFRSAGLRIERYRSNALLRRIPACLRRLRVPDIVAAMRAIAERPARCWEILDVVLLGVTEFCRDRAVFARLQQVELPALAARRRRLRIWSAGCSEGQELYSVAALLAHLDLLEGCELVGTDCRPEAIARARNGEYAVEAAQDLPAELRRTLLLSLPDRARIHPRLQTAACWRVSDLLAAAETGPWDMILCRNLAIYLEPMDAAALWRRLALQLAPGGLLVTGKAENPSLTAPFERLDACLYRQRGG